MAHDRVRKRSIVAGFDYIAVIESEVRKSADPAHDDRYAIANGDAADTSLRRLRIGEDCERHATEESLQLSFGQVGTLEVDTAILQRKRGVARSGDPQPYL